MAKVNTQHSQSARKRKIGRHQVDERRESILIEAERLFLIQGLEQTSMIDIAQSAGISKVTLYRYFSDKNPITFEIAARMLNRITTRCGVPDETVNDSERIKACLLNMIRCFDELRDAYRYIGLFDHLYASSYPSQELADWYKAQVERAGRQLFAGELDIAPETRRSVVTLVNVIMSFLEKMAARGELMGDEQGTALGDQLTIFERFVTKLIEEKE